MPANLGMPHVEGVSHRFVELDGLRVHVAEAGAGPAVVLQHGWPQHWWAWREVFPRLAPRYRLVCPDLRGHGWSDAPKARYEKEALATDLLRLLDVLELGRVRLIGHDWGAFAGFLACLRAPERFTHLLALSMLHPWPPVRRPDPLRLLKSSYQTVISTPLVGAQVVRRTGFVPFLLRASRTVGDWSEQELATYRDRFRDPSRAGAAVSLYRSFLLRELPSLLRGDYRGRRLTVPTQLLVGERDPVLHPRSLTGYEDQADDMALESVPDAGHWLPEETPQAVVDAALTLFERQASPGVRETGG